MSQKTQNVENYLLDTAIKVIEADEQQNHQIGRNQEDIWFDQVAKINSIVWENGKKAGMSEKEIAKAYPREKILEAVQSISNRLSSYKTV